MREIKFRAWDKEGKRMIHQGFALVPGDEGSLDFFGLEYLCGDNALPHSNDIEHTLKTRYDIDFPGIIDFADFSFETMVLMQYTGLKDKNGKEVYEGDVVQTYLTEHTKGPVCEIRYLDRSFVMAQYPDDTEMDCIWYYLFEVIGNIYENPELLSTP